MGRFKCNFSGEMDTQLAVYVRKIDQMVYGLTRKDLQNKKKNYRRKVASNLLHKTRNNDTSANKNRFNREKYVLRSDASSPCQRRQK